MARRALRKFDVIPSQPSLESTLYRVRPLQWGLCEAALPLRHLYAPEAAAVLIAEHIHSTTPLIPSPSQLSVLRLFEAILSDVSIKRAPDFQVRLSCAIFSLISSYAVVSRCMLP